MTVFGHQSVVNFNLVVGYFCAPTPLVCTQCLVEFNCRHFFFSYKYSPHFIRKKSLKCVNRIRKGEWNISTALFCSLLGTRNNQNLVNQPMMCCCKYLDNQTSCPSRQALSDRGRPSDAEVCGGGEASTPYTNAAYLRIPPRNWLHVHMMAEPMDLMQSNLPLYAQRSIKLCRICCIDHAVNNNST